MRLALQHPSTLSACLVQHHQYQLCVPQLLVYPSFAKIRKARARLPVPYSRFFKGSSYRGDQFDAQREQDFPGVACCSLMPGLYMTIASWSWYSRSVEEDRVIVSSIPRRESKEKLPEIVEIAR